MGAITCQLVPVESVRPLRHLVLRAVRPFETCIWDGDELPDTRHFAVYADERVAAIGTLLHRAHEVAPGPHAWQIRGMATHPESRGCGLGKLLLEFMLAHCRGRDNGHIVWCNARTSAAGFYQRFDFETVGGEFDIPEVGPHVVMRRRLV